ncbi:MAG TPA: ABC transporter substrate-binding protein [Polyangiaceae bacterium]|nr:ABC transporter substrate-binding protein [Polyangiaceae bacterium]
MTVCTSCQERPAQSVSPVENGSGSPLPILVGHIDPLARGQTPFGESAENGLKLAILERNQRNGIKGRKIELESIDDHGSEEEAAEAAVRLVSQHHVSVIFGEVASRRSFAMAPIADANRTPMIAIGATEPKVTLNGDKTRPYVFRACFADPFQGAVMAQFARNKLKVGKAAILRAAGNDYSEGLARSFARRFNELGGQIVADESFKAGDEDFKRQLTGIQAQKPDTIFVPGYYTDVAVIARQARAFGLRQPFLGGDGWDSAKLFELAQGALDGSFFSEHYAPSDPSPAVQDFIARYKAAFGTTPDALAVLGYEAGELAFDAMNRASDLTGPAIRDALEQTKDLKGVTGTIRFDAHHDAVKSAVVIRVGGNRADYAASIEP